MTARFLEGFVILFCGLDEAKRSKATEAVLRYGGKCVEKYSKEVTCGIVERVGSAGYKELLASKVKILTTKWLQDSINRRSLMSVDAAEYRVGIFTGLNVVCTQLTIEERTRVQEVVTSGGGKFCDRFVGNVCTHLVAKTPEGEKYIAAKKCGTVRIVTIAWIDECVKQKVWVPELEFTVDFLAKQAKREAQLAAEKAKQALAAALIATTAPTREPSFVETLEHLLCNEIDVSQWPSPLHLRTAMQNCLGDELIWIHGYSPQVTDYITTSVLAAGGLRSMVLCDAVTMVILGERTTSSEWTLVQRHPCSVLQANLVWLMEHLHTLPILLNLVDKHPTVAEFLQTMQPQQSDTFHISASMTSITTEEKEKKEMAPASDVSLETLSARYEDYVASRRSTAKQTHVGSGKSATATTSLIPEVKPEIGVKRSRSDPDSAK